MPTPSQPTTHPKQCPLLCLCLFKYLYIYTYKYMYVCMSLAYGIVMPLHVNIILQLIS